MAESSKNRCGIERLETLISNMEAKTATVATPNQFENQFEGFKVSGGLHKTRYCVPEP